MRQIERPQQSQHPGLAVTDAPALLHPSVQIGDPPPRDFVQCRIGTAEYDRGQFVTFSAEELRAVDVESSKNAIYFDTPYYLYPDGPIAVEALRVIGVAMAEAGVAGIGRLTLSRRERMVMVEPRGTGMALFTLRAADEVRPAQFGSAEGDLDAEMVAIARAIMSRRIGNFDPTAFRDGYQEALRGLIETKLKGLPIKRREVITPPPVIDLMAALKCSLAADTTPTHPRPPEKSGKAVTDRRQRSLLLPVAGGRKK